MIDRFDPAANYAHTRELAQYVSRSEATAETYQRIGFKCGLEIHQQLLTARKLFCNCPAGIYQEADDYDAELVRHMRPTLSELGEYDGTALMEFKTKKNIIYRIKNETACTYDIDDTPPFRINQQALDIAIEIALMLKTNIVGELHITRKQYLDGSIPTGFQRTAIVGIEGAIPILNKMVRIIQISIEEDACREVSDIGHWRIYRTDRLGMPLIETVTYPDLLTPEEAAEAAHYLRFLARASGKVRVGIGAAREDVNVSVTGGTRVEIKGVAHIRWIPLLTHNEAFRQWSLLLLRDELKKRGLEPKTWSVSFKDLYPDLLPREQKAIKRVKARGWDLAAINLPKFEGVLSWFTQPGKSFATELSDRLKVIACLERPNMIHSEQNPAFGDEHELADLRNYLGAQNGDAQIVVWGPPDDVKTAIETIEERCRLAMTGIPNETRKGLPDGTTIFERVLPGPDRMYPDTDSAPIPIDDAVISGLRQNLPIDVQARMQQLREWNVPRDCWSFILKKNLVELLEKIVIDLGQDPIFVASLLAHKLKNTEGQVRSQGGFAYEKIYDLFVFGKKRGLFDEILKPMAATLFEHPNMDFESILTVLDYKPQTLDQLKGYLPILRQKFKDIDSSKDPEAGARWIMGQLRKRAYGNVCMQELRQLVDAELRNG